MIAIKSTDPIELEKLCLLESKISEIENLFQVTERAYRKLIDSLFVNDNFLTEIDKCLAYNYPITTQECMLSLTCETNSSSSPETKKCTASPSNLKECISSKLKSKKSTTSPTTTKQSTSSSPESKECTASTSNLKECTASNLKLTKVLRHLQHRKKVLRHLQNQNNVLRHLQT